MLGTSSHPHPVDRFSSHAPFHFDLSILDLYVPIKHGATLVLIGEQEGKDPGRLAAAIAEKRISSWYSTPSILNLLVNYGNLADYEFPNLRLVLFAGEVFPIKHLRALKSVWPEPRYYNLYGPTETNVCTFLEIPAVIPEERSDPFPIGKPCTHVETWVVDAEGRGVSPGSEGELVVRGAPVTDGYWNLEPQTREAFLTDEDGTTWYRTGDLVVEEPSGDFVYVGRRDRMVKKRGYRVELGEIEACLYRNDDIEEAAAVAIPDDESGVKVRAFVRTKPDGQRSIIKLKRFCIDNLPQYMVPDVITFLEDLPKTSTDKINYQQLKEMA